MGCCGCSCDDKKVVAKKTVKKVVKKTVAKKK